MQNNLLMPLLAALSFLMGSIPFGLLFTRPLGINLRKIGSGNIGATNVLRAAGKGPAILTLIGDLLKGAAAVAIGKLLGADLMWQGIMGISAVIGHDFSPFLRFRGGKGVATSMGVVLVYTPLMGAAALALWITTVALTRYSSLGALVAFTLLPIIMAAMGYPNIVLTITAIITTLIVTKHAQNIKRLINKTEQKVGQKT